MLFLCVVQLLVCIALVPTVKASDVGKISGEEIDGDHRSLQQPTTTTTTKVLIIGGGAAGLFAAYTLDAAGVDFLLLEAKSEVGGRTRELSGFVDVPFDLGAEWIHYDPAILQELLIYDEDKAAVAESIQIIDYRPQTAEVYALGRLRSRPLLMFISTLIDADWKFYNTTWFSYLYTNVYSYVSDRVLKDIPVRTIDYSNTDKIVVTSVDNRVFEAERVIVATPVTILKDTTTLEFVPDLPRAHRQAIDSIYMPAGLKVWIEFEERFYSDVVLVESVALYVLRGIRGSTKYYLDAVFGKPTERNVLLLFQVGDSEDLLRRVAMSDDELIADVLAELDEVYDGKASRYYIQHNIQNWSADPYIRGSYSLSLVNFLQLRRPIEDRVFLAGAYLGGADQSTVYGASLSGKRAAELVAASLE